MQDGAQLLMDCTCSTRRVWRATGDNGLRPEAAAPPPGGSAGGAPPRASRKSIMTGQSCGRQICTQAREGGSRPGKCLRGLGVTFMIS